jgi:hypothetical protein
MKSLYLCLFLLLSAYLSADLPDTLVDEVLRQGITVDLRDPSYCNGVLKTEKGGVITGPNIRVQALKFLYTQKNSEEGRVTTLHAEENIIVEYGDYVLIGDAIDYDFETQTGKIVNGVSALEPWYFGGDVIELLPNGDISVENGYLTTSDRDKPNWYISMCKAIYTPCHDVYAEKIRFNVYDKTFLYVPSLNANLDWIFDSPIRYRVRFGGQQGLRFGIIYELIAMENFKTYVRLDYRVRSGPGIGVTTEYDNPNGKEYLYTINYVAKDNSVDDPDEKYRYRFNGIYYNSLMDDTLTVDIQYDKLSDQDMPTDYSEKGFELETAGRTELHVRKQFDDLLITNFYARPRINNFQSILQELPTFGGELHPKSMWNTGIVSETQAKASYLDFEYSKGLIDVKDYNSTRFAYTQNFYRPIQFSPVTFVPNAGLVFIQYSSSPAHNSQTVILGTFGAELTSKLYRDFSFARHVVEPYVRYQFLTQPSSSPDNHYVFDIEDGWYRVNRLRFGVKQLLYNCLCYGLFRNLSVDVYANAFFHTPTIYHSIPRGYADIGWNTTSRLRNTCGAAWDFERNQVGYFNLKTEWTANENLAISTEYRHRNAYTWRKVDYDNYNLDSFRSEHELRHSQLSDRRDTWLFDTYYRFMPNWALQFELRHGWNRMHEPSYTEYEIDLITKLQSAWDLRLSYQHRENDHRIAFYFSLGMDRPDNYCR